jgi:hypothetical protein
MRASIPFDDCLSPCVRLFIESLIDERNQASEVPVNKSAQRNASAPYVKLEGQSDSAGLRVRL